jgi:hypothetical protein
MQHISDIRPQHLFRHQRQAGAQDRPSIQVSIRRRIQMARQASILPWCWASAQVSIRWRIQMAPPVLSPSLVPSLSPSFNPSENPNGTTDINPSLVPSLNPSSNPSESPSCLSEYECMRLRKIKRNEARLVELGLLVPLAPRSKTNRRKRVVMQDDVGRRVQSKRNVSTPSSYKDLDDHVINK